jgi:predicted ATPase/DNA-binding XRE family transcriptional regulator
VVSAAGLVTFRERTCPHRLRTRHKTGTLWSVPAYPEAFGAALRRLREHSGLTQEQLAERAGLSPRAIRALERGERQHPYPHTVRSLAVALRLSADERATLEGAVSPRGPRFSLPSSPTPLIGRQREVRAATALLSSGPTRLLTLVGTGGVGKTRLALAVAEEVRTRFADGGAMVSLAPLRDARLVVTAIARSLDLRESGGETLREVLHGYLRSRHALLVLDNFEHLRDATTEVADLLDAAPGLRVLVTSRSPLRLQAEQVYRVAPLPPTPAVELFIASAARAAPESAETGTDIDVVSEICKRLDGLPLAIELAAARTRILTPAALLHRLDRTLTVLVDGPRDAPERQHTLRHAISWSYDLLTAAEQTMFRALSVFVGGWRLDATMAVGEVDEPTAIDLHARLLDHSLVIRESGAAEPRFGLLETIRSYAAERLEAAGEWTIRHDRHAAHFRHLLLSADNEMLGPALPEWLDRLQLEQDNIRAAMKRMLETGQIEGVAEMCFTMWLFWFIRGPVREGQRLVEGALAHDGILTASGRAMLLFTGGAMILPSGRYDESAALLDDAVRLARHAGDQRTLARTLTLRGYVAAIHGQPKLARAVLDQAETLSRDVDELVSATLAASIKAVLTRRGLTEAEPLLVRCEDEMRELGMPWSLAVTLNLHGWVRLQLGEPVGAEELLREAVVILGRLQDIWAMMHGLTLLADAASLRSEPERAARLYGAADLLVERSGATLFRFYQPLTEHCRAIAAEPIGAGAFEALRQEGRALRPEELMAYASHRD